MKFRIHDLNYDKKKEKIKEFEIKPIHDVVGPVYFGVWETFKNKFSVLLQNYFINKGFIHTAIEIIDNRSYSYINMHFFSAKKSVTRTISLKRKHLWPCVNKDHINTYSVVLDSITATAYYGGIKPNFDESVDNMLKEESFKNFIEHNIRVNLNYPFGHDEEIEIKEEQQLKDDESNMLSKLINSAIFIEGQIYYLVSLLKSQVQNINEYNFYGFSYEKSDSGLKIFFNMKNKKKTHNFDIVFHIKNENYCFKNNRLCFFHLHSVSIENFILTLKTKKAEKEIVHIEEKYNKLELYNTHVNYANFPFTR